MNRAGNDYRPPLGLRSVALFEFAKGVLVLVIGLGAVSLIHKDAQSAAEKILHAVHLDPAWHYSRLFIEEAAKLNDTRLWYVGMFAFAYAAVRFVETYGLWHGRPWAEWFAVLSASFYVPVEIHHIIAGKESPWIRVGLFVLNIVIVAYLGRLLLLNHRRKMAHKREREAS